MRDYGASCPEFAVPLPPSVEQLLKLICREQNQPSLAVELRRRLAELGEAGSLEILGAFASAKVNLSLRDHIVRLLGGDSLQSPPRKSARVDSTTSSLHRSPGSSPHLRTVRVYGHPKEEVPSSSEIGRAEKEALGDLEGNELHRITTVNEIKHLQNLPMTEFETQVWNRFGRISIDEKDRRKMDWDSRSTYIYDCHVSVEGRFTFKGPFLCKQTTHLQKVLGDDNVLRVKFAEDTANLGIGSLHHCYAGYRRVAIEEGILVGLRRYYFFVFKDGGKEDRKKNPTSSSVKCYFIRLRSDARIDTDARTKYVLLDRTIYEARSLFMHVHTLSNTANYMARFSLILSKTLSLDIDLASVNMEIVDDVYCTDEYGEHIYRDGKLLIHSDGTGDISEDLALMCPKNIHKGIMCDHDEEVNGVAEAAHLRVGVQEPPMLIQCRLFNNGYAIKGTFLVNKKLGPKTIKVRKSMVKVERDANLHNHFSFSKKQHSLEVVGTSNKPKRTRLSRNLIALLSYGGVPDQFFKDLLEDALRETNGSFNSIRTAHKAALHHLDYDPAIAEMIRSGIPLDEPYLRQKLSSILKDQKTRLKNGKIYIPDSYYLMGTVDPTGKLQSHEVCIVLDNIQVTADVLVYRNPGLHFGDIRVMKATYVEDLVSVIGKAKYVVFFSRKGPRSVADELAGGDFDGDEYWISRHPTLLHYFKPSEPWIPNLSTSKVNAESQKATKISDEDFENELFKRFLTLRFNPSYAMGEAAESCQAMMDRLLTLDNECSDEKNRLKDNIIKLNDVYCLALDAPKKGLKVEVPNELKAKKYPHYMEKKNSYRSTSILGYIYDRVQAYLEEEDYSNKGIWKLPQFTVSVPENCLTKWEPSYKEYRDEMAYVMRIQDNDLRKEAAAAVRRKYKKMLYGAEDMEERTRKIEDIYNEALAIYDVCYRYAQSQGSVGLCGFAWNVAGSALCSYQIVKHLREKPVLGAPSILRNL